MDSLIARTNYITSKFRDYMPDCHPVYDRWNMAGAFNGALFVKDRVSATLYFYRPKTRKAIDSPLCIDLEDMSIILTTNAQVNVESFREIVVEAHEESKSIPEKDFKQVRSIEVSTMDPNPGIAQALKREFPAGRVTSTAPYDLDEDTYQDFEVRFDAPIPHDQAAQAIRRVFPISVANLFGVGEVFATLVKRNAPVKWAHVIARQY